jgi:CMP/dCMP kinase
MYLPDNDIIIAVDGYSSCGKSTFAKRIANELGYIYIDSGAMYRAVALFCLRNSIISGDKVDVTRLKKELVHIHIEFTKNNTTNKVCTCLNGENVEELIRGVEVSGAVSYISKIKEVRKRLVQIQRKLGEEKRIVMDGRDIGTTVFPEAELKIFMIADVDVRANRRYEELKEKGLDVSFEDIKKNIEQRDYNDVHREVSPLKQAANAKVLDNSYMTVDEQMKWFEKELKSLNI